MSTDRIFRWRLLIEEYGPTFVHIKGEHNVIADALSRLDVNFSGLLGGRFCFEIVGLSGLFGRFFFENFASGLFGRSFFEIVVSGLLRSSFFENVVIFDVDAQSGPGLLFEFCRDFLRAGGEVADMAHAGLNDVIVAQKACNFLGFRGRFDDH